VTGLTRVLSSQEPWAEYQLEDGTLIRFRFSACAFRRTGKVSEQGDPEYHFASQVQCETHARPVAASLSEHAFKLFELSPKPREAPDNGMPSDSPYQAPDQDCG
jgi:hypothetical protein